MKIDLEDPSSTSHDSLQERIEIFNESMEEIQAAITQHVKQQMKYVLERRSLNDVNVDDPRPPIKQRLGIEGEIGKCPHCQSNLTHHDKKGKWICPHCDL